MSVISISAVFCFPYLWEKGEGGWGEREGVWMGRAGGDGVCEMGEMYVSGSRQDGIERRLRKGGQDMS